MTAVAILNDVGMFYYLLYTLNECILSTKIFSITVNNIVKIYIFKCIIIFNSNMGHHHACQ